MKVIRSAAHNVNVSKPEEAPHPVSETFCLKWTERRITVCIVKK